MASERLRHTIVAVSLRLRRGEIRGEAEVSEGIVRPLLKQLGWPVLEDTTIVRPEFPIGNRRVDFALCHPPDRPAVLLEVMNLGKADAKGEEQLFQYCFHEGVRIAVLTDGRHWNLFLPAGRGTYAERRFATWDLAGDSAAMVAGGMLRYLGFNAVRSGDAYRQAQENLERRWHEQDIDSALPAAWKRLLTEPPERLIALVRDRVEGAMGVCPSAEKVSEFLAGQVNPSPAPAVRRNPSESVRTQPSSTPLMAARETPAASTECWFKLDGRTRRFPNAKRCFVALFVEFARRDPQLLPAFRRSAQGEKSGVDRADQKCTLSEAPGASRVEH